MKRSIKKLTNYNIITSDGTKASINDFLFDEDMWTVRYLSLDFGGFFDGKTVLLPNQFIRNSHIINDEIYVDITTNELESCPKPEDDMPVSRKYEEKLINHFNLDRYWENFHVSGFAGIPRQMPPDDFSELELNIENGLHSFNEIKGFDITTLDGKFGVVDDMVFDDADWRITYLAIDTSFWLPWSKKFLVDINVIDYISYEDEEAKIHMHEQMLKNAPEYDLDMLMDENYQNRLNEFYAQSLV